ncbi:MAG: hypothetical protein ACRENE_10945 [Polyangiaceae bacterium]
MSRLARSLVSLPSLALIGAGLFGLAASGCNFLVGVGDYAAGTASDGSSDSAVTQEADGSSDAGPATGDGAGNDDGGGEASLPAEGGGEASTGGDGALDAPGDVAIDSPAEGGGGCAPDPAVTCTAGNGVGYTCPGSHFPEETHPRWDCGSPVTTTSTTSSYCCWTCGSDSAVTGCPLHYTGESCDDTDTPNDDFGDNCTATSSPGIGAHGFCCSAVASVSCSTNADCSGSSSYGVCGPTGTCTLASGAIGDPCSTVADCASSLVCNGAWCRTSSCTSDTSCSTASSGLPNQCLAAGSSGDVCFASCANNGDCSVYTNTFCLSGGASSSYGVCSATSGGLGDPCASSSDCTGTLFCSYDLDACSQTCTGSSDTSCGTNANGKTNVCVYDSYDAQYECAAGCSTNKDCLAYSYGGIGTTCTSVTGGSACE